MHHSNGIILYSALFFFSGDLTPEQVLMDYLKSNTRNIGRPINNVTKAINVTLDLTPIQLVNFVSRNPIIFCRLLSLLSTADTWCFFCGDDVGDGSDNDDDDDDDHIICCMMLPLSLLSH